MKKRIFSAFLAMCMCLSLLPVSAMAAEHDHNTGDWKALTTTSGTLEEGSYYLAVPAESAAPETSLTLTGNLTISGAVTLCLNGQTLDCGNYYIEVSSGASLTICDCSTGGYVTGSNWSGTVQNYGILTLESGKVENTYSYSGSQAVYNAGTFYLTGGEVSSMSGCGLFNSGSTEAKISGGSITGGSAAIYNDYSSEKVYLSNTPTLTSGENYADIYSGTVYANDGSTDAPAYYTGEAITVQRRSSYPNGEAAVCGVNENNKSSFTSFNINYTLNPDEGDPTALVYKGVACNLTWLDRDGTTTLTGDSYPTIEEYGESISPPTYSADNQVFLGWKYKVDNGEFNSNYASSSQRITGAMTFQADAVAAMPGSGTIAEPYEIDSTEDLKTLATIANSGNTTYNNRDVWYKLTGSIDLNNEEWTPIGKNSSCAFQANFDGGEHTVSNLKITGTNSYCGLFGYVYGDYSIHTKIQNVTVSGSVSGSSNVGMLAGYASYADIANCTVSGTVQGSDYGYQALVGTVDSSVILTGNNTSACHVSPMGYTTDDNGVMAFGQGDGSLDIVGCYKGKWIQTTYSNNGYRTETQTDSESMAVTVKPAFLNDGKYIQLNYTVTAGNSAVSGGKLAVHADVQIGDNDAATVEVIKDRAGKAIGLRMVDTHTNGCASQDATSTSAALAA